MRALGRMIASSLTIAVLRIAGRSRPSRIFAK
jgi:hypothetical protein